MGAYLPAAVGMPLSEVDTPALILDLDAFERNLDRMDASLAGKRIRLRPHAKSHKSPDIAKRQIARGAVGVCCQKTSEAEAMVDGGVPDVLIANEVVGAAKLRRLAALAKRARIAVCADDEGNVADLDEAARAAGVTLDVLVEVNVGANRCGVEPGEPAVRLARAITGSKNLRFTGLQAYQGAAQHLRRVEERRSAIEAACARVKQTTERLALAGIPCEHVTGAGTGTYLFEAVSGVYHELQAGSYIFMDVDSGMPRVADIAGAEYMKISDEHGVLKLDAATRIAVGDKLKLIPGHCDPTVNLYDHYVCVRGGKVEALWPITARGAVW